MDAVSYADVERAVTILQDRIAIVDERIAILTDERRSLHNALATMQRVKDQIISGVGV